MRGELRELLLAEAASHVRTYPADMDGALSEGMARVRRRLIRTWVVVIVSALVLAAGLVTARILVSGAAAAESLTVTGPSNTLLPGASAQLEAEAAYSDGTRRSITEGLAWASENPAVAAVAATGEVTAVAPGSAAVTATFDGVSGRFELTVTTPDGAALTGLAIRPGEASVDVGGKVQLTAEGNYSNGALGKLNAEAFWSSADPGTARVDGNGLVTGGRPGATDIIAAHDGFEATARITVTTPPPVAVTGLSVDPAEVTVKQGQSVQLTAIAASSDGTSAPATDVAWSSSNPQVATVSATGLLAGRSVGQTLVEAVHVDQEGREWRAQSKVTVEHVAVAVVVSPAGPHALQPGASLQLTAAVRYSDGRPGKPVISWASSRPVFVSVSSSGLVRAGGQGEATITATVDGVSSGPVFIRVGIPAPDPGPAE